MTERDCKISFWELVTVILLVLFLCMTKVEGQTKYELTADESLIALSRTEMLKNVGTVEKTGHNDGKVIAKILKSVGINYPASYCQAYVYSCFDEARKIIQKECCKIVSIPIPKSAVAQSSFIYAERNGKKVKYVAKTDDLIIWKSLKGWTGHIERIFKVLEKGNVMTVGANTSNGLKGSQRQGNGIFIRKRNVKHILGRMKVRGLVGFKGN